MPRVLIIADDLTGALDSASGFAARGMATRIVLKLEDLAGAIADPHLDVIAYPSGTRELSSAGARRRLEPIVVAVTGFDGIVFKKIDSRLKGHIALELAALRVAFPLPVIASPAIPRLGRLVRHRAVTGAAIAVPIPIDPVLGCMAAVPDISSDADLSAALPEQLNDALYVGAAGLAEALARRLTGLEAKAADQIPAPLLLAIGSRDPVTLAQIAQAPLGPVLAPNGVVPALAGQMAVLVQMSPGANPVAPADAGLAFSAGVCREIRSIGAASLFGCGGETVHAILNEFGITTLDLLGEVLPGVPLARCPASGLTVITKSGGFGDPDLLCELMNKFAKSR